MVHLLASPSFVWHVRAALFPHSPSFAPISYPGYLASIGRDSQVGSKSKYYKGPGDQGLSSPSRDMADWDSTRQLFGLFDP